MIDKIYAIRLSPYYIKGLPLELTKNFKEARTYSTIGPAKAMRTKVLRAMLNNPIQCWHLIKKGNCCYLGFPMIVEYKIEEIGVININD